MDQTVLDWLLEDINPEVRLRTLKEYEHFLPNRRYENAHGRRYVRDILPAGSD